MSTKESNTELASEKPLIIDENNPKANIEESESSDEDAPIYESDFSDEDSDDFMNLNDDAEVYLLCKDNNPVCYFKNKKLATEMMWKIARYNKGKFMNNFTLFIKENSEDSISIVGYNKFLLLSFERLFSTFTILPVKEVISVNNEATKSNTEVKSNVDTTNSRWW